MSTSLSKNLFSISEWSLFEFITCLDVHVCIWTLHKWFYLWNCPVCMEILIIHIVWMIDVYTHVKIFTLVSQVSDSMMLLVPYISHLLQYMYLDIYVIVYVTYMWHICNIYADIYVTYVTDIYVTYMSVTHIERLYVFWQLINVYKYKYSDIYLTIICPLYFTW